MLIWAEEMAYVGAGYVLAELETEHAAQILLEMDTENAAYILESWWKKRVKKPPFLRFKIPCSKV